MRNEGSLPESFRCARAVEIAARQWGEITTAQLRAIGFSRGAIANMVERGLLHPRHRGVFTFGALSPAPEQRWAAALLAAGEGAALSHTSAGAFHGQLPVREVIEVVAPTRRRGDERLRVRTPRRFEALRTNGLTVTTPAQTLLDLASIGWPIDRMTPRDGRGLHRLPRKRPGRRTSLQRNSAPAWVDFAMPTGGESARRSVDVSPLA